MRASSCCGLAIAAVLGLAGCQTARPLYHWGSYESLAYLSYAKPDKATLEVQREKLQADVAASAAHAPHPGLHAQLGYVYFQLNQVDEAVKEFELEKTLFPEATIFMDRMIQQAMGGPAT
jgi:hypothetical protein